MTDLPLPTVRPSAPPGADGPLVDTFGRIAKDLRVSVTDRCNLRCTYCMPAEGLPWLPKPDMLTDDEMVRLIALFVRLGVRQVRLTGGEPLLRRSLVSLIGRISELDPRPTIALDTIDREEFLSLTRRDRLADVEAGLKAAHDAGLTPVKVNAVTMRGVNDADVADLLAWCIERDYELRFIEQMPLDAGHEWQAAALTPSASSPASAHRSVRPATGSA